MQQLTDRIASDQWRGHCRLISQLRQKCNDFRYKNGQIACVGIITEAGTACFCQTA